MHSQTSALSETSDKGKDAGYTMRKHDVMAMDKTEDEEKWSEVGTEIMLQLMASKRTKTKRAGFARNQSSILQGEWRTARN